jgi:uncharacterized protein YgfB (UPF0149 family)
MFDVPCEKEMKRTRIAINQAFLLGDGLAAKGRNRASEIQKIIESIADKFKAPNVTVEALTSETDDVLHTSTAAAVDEAVSDLPGIRINSRKRSRYCDNSDDDGESSDSSSNHSS